MNITTTDYQYWVYMEICLTKHVFGNIVIYYTT